ncbi:hypothetical protein MKEN_01090900 [Mycena kentingensis (nom. inval.)]|nr:hypothetical protein MKEN_01090900 [Mycena kentingensis (nom. inval.)]
MLLRSRSAPLVIRADLQHDPQHSPEPIILEYASRLSTLDICGPSNTLEMFFSNLQPSVGSTTRLRCLRVISTSDPQSTPLWLPRNFLRCKEDAQKLEANLAPVQLHLHGCAFPWDSPSYSNITHLHLANISPLQSPTTEQLLEILVTSPRLETLALVHCSLSSLRGFPVTLPQLTSFVLSTESTAIFILLLHFLRLPDTAMVTVTCKDRPNHAYRLAIHLFCKSSSASQYDTVQIRHQNGLILHLSHSCTSYSRVFRLEMSKWAEGNNIVVATESILDALDFSSVTTLHLAGFESIPRRVGTNGELVCSLLLLYIRMSRYTPRLHTLHIHGSFPPRWLDFMLAEAMLRVGVSHYLSCLGSYQINFIMVGPTWPSLRRLCLHAIDFAAPVVTFRQPDTTPPTLAAVLRALMWARKRGHAPFWRLQLADGCSGLTTTDVSEFEVFVDVDHMQPEGDTASGNATRFMSGLPEQKDSEALREEAIGAFAAMVESIGRIVVQRSTLRADGASASGV